MCFEDLDYCLRVFEAGLECIYEPTVVATHREKFFRGKADDEDRSNGRASRPPACSSRWGRTDLSQWVPEVL